jgi:hypothetical protein
VITLTLASLVSVKRLLLNIHDYFIEILDTCNKKRPILLPVAVSAAVCVSSAGTSLVVAAASCWFCIQELL